MQLRAMSKAKSVGYKIHAIESKRGKAENKELNAWIKNSMDLSNVKQSHFVKYARSMPDIETLMQAWTPEIESLMNELVVLISIFSYLLFRTKWALKKSML